VDTFPIAKMTFVWVLVSLATAYHWSHYQLDIKNVFLNGVLYEEVYMGNHHALLLRESVRSIAG